MYQITKDTIVYDIMVNAPVTQPLFQRIGMHCLGWAMQACMAHGVEVEPFVKEVNDYIASHA